MRFFKIAFTFFAIICSTANGQNLVIDGAISNNANWNGQEAPFSAGTYQSAYMAACGTNYVMEVDAASAPTQTVNGFNSGMVYVLSFRYAYRTVSCGPSNNPTFLRIRFTDATAVLDYTLSIPNTQTTFATFSFSFTNNAATTHTLQFTNLGNVNTCGVVVDDISLLKLSSPGGIPASNLSYWIKASSIGLPDNSNVYAWISQGNNVITVAAPCANPPLYKTGLASVANNFVANYNPYLTFNGTNQYLDYTATRVDFMETSAGGLGGSFFSAYMGGSSNRSYFGHQSSASDRLFGKTDSVIFAFSTAIGTNNRMRYTVGSRVNIISANGKSNGLITRDLNGASNPLNNSVADVDYLTVGVRRNSAGTYNQHFNGSLSEVMLFNSILSNTQMQQVRSYLASKYGVTLTNNTTTAGIDERTYLATNGTTQYWDFVANSAFHNNVTVIGRDDATDLNQQRSLSTDADAGSNTGNSMLMIDNGTTINSDMSYLAAGHNGTVIPNPGGADFFDVPVGIQSRLKRVWKFQKTGTGISNNVTVRFDMTGFGPITGTDLRLLVSTSTVFNPSSIIVGAYTAPYFTATLPTTGGVFFTIGSINKVSTPLPITLLSFVAEPDNNTVVVNWSTVNELNSNFYSVQRSQDGLNFTDIGNVKASGTSNSRRDYQFIDSNPLNDISYYRLKLTDIDGSINTYNIVSVVFENNDLAEFTIFPNPGKGEFTLDFLGIENNHEVEITITDGKGAKIYEGLFYSQTINHNQVAISLKSDTPVGVYYCKITFEGISKTIKLFIN
ncbi:MAG: T9SS type A sorting domain-containing protein [Bacteroidota bacterium]|nr:T9SS type A sorting domain-containing protein [Bacteroidota bacterium]